MRTSQIGNLHKRLITDAEAGTSRRPARRPFVPRASNVIGRIRYRQQQNHASAKPQAGPRRIGAFLLAAALALAIAVTAPAREYDPPIVPLVTNMLQSSRADRSATLSGVRDGLYQAFRTGPNPGGYELKSIWLYVRNTLKSRYMTIAAGLYRGALHGGVRVATLTRGQLNDFAHNEWRAPANTFLESDTRYVFILNCTAGCANDSGAEIGATRRPRG